MRLRRVARKFALLSVLTVGACSTFGGEEPTPSPADAGVLDTNLQDAPTDGPIGDACKARPLTAWSTPKPLGLVGPKGELHFVDPFVSADGLTLVLGLLDGPRWRVFRATRPSRSSSWSTPQPLEGFTSNDYARPYPSTFASSSDELVAAIEAIHTDMGGIVRDGGTWGSIVFDELKTPDVELAPTVTSDGTTIVYLQVNAPRDTNQFRGLRQATRGAPSASSKWGGQGGITTGPDGGDGMPRDLTWPALTPDGRGLFFVTDSAEHRVRYASRVVRTGSFFDGKAAAVEIDDLSSAAGTQSRVRSMTEDGCEVYLTSDRGGVAEAWVATRR